jgi:integrase
LYDKFLIKWKTRRLADIKRSDVSSLHSKIGEDNGRYEANRVLALVRAIFNFAIEQLDFQGTNPAIGVKKFAEESRDRYLLPDELPRFFEALEEEESLFKDFFLLCLFTGARRSNVASMRWEDLQGETWRIPVTKNGKPVFIPLVPEAQAILQTRKEQADDSPYVFASYVKSGYLAEPKTAWARITARANLSDLRIHDLRRTLGSYQAAQGTSLAIIGKMLGHRTHQATQVYARLDLDPVRQSAVKATSTILALAKPEKSKSQIGPWREDT